MAVASVGGLLYLLLLVYMKLCSKPGSSFADQLVIRNFTRFGLNFKVRNTDREIAFGLNSITKVN